MGPGIARYQGDVVVQSVVRRMDGVGPGGERRLGLKKS